MHVEPNSRQYILRPTEHISAQQSLLNNKFGSSSNKSPETTTASKNIGKDRSGNVALTNNTIKTASNRTVTIKNNKKYKMQTTDSMVDPHYQYN